MCFIVFFFKQKTAYEMRISDWSSDVCSSDLGTNVALLTALAHVIVTEQLVAEDFVAQRCEAKAFDQWRDFVARPENSPEATAEIGRASCRERVCQYV